MFLATASDFFAAFLLKFLFIDPQNAFDFAGLGIYVLFRDPTPINLVVAFAILAYGIGVDDGK